MKMSRASDSNYLLSSLVRCDDNHGSGISRCWELVNIENCGRGICATRNIDENELIFSEVPLLLGPIGNRNDPLICVACYQPMNHINVCPNECGLPMCGSGCKQASNHKEICDLLKSWTPINGGGKISYEVLKILTAIQALLLSDQEKYLLELLQSNRLSKNEECVDVTVKNFQNFPDNPNLREFLKRTISVLNTNAFQTVIRNDDRIISLKGLYALHAQLNHHCVPNTRYSVDSKYITSVFAAKKIRKGEEITTTYTNLLWNTQTRRTHLHLTKQFWCQCSRCADPAEYQSYLAALKCLSKSCVLGRLLPLAPLCLTSSWKCDQCETVFDFKKVFNFQEVISSIMRTKINEKLLSSLMDALKDGQILTRSLCQSNQIIVELKLNLIWKIDENVTVEEVLIKERYCREILNLLDLLSTCESTLKGLLLFELYKCQKLTEIENNESLLSQRKLLDHSWRILKGNLAAPTALTVLCENKSV